MSAAAIWARASLSLAVLGLGCRFMPIYAPARSGCEAGGAFCMDAGATSDRSVVDQAGDLLPAVDASSAQATDGPAERDAPGSVDLGGETRAPDGGGPAARCDRRKRFGPPRLVEELDAPGLDDLSLRLTADELSGYFVRGGLGLHRVSRISKTAPFTDIDRLGGDFTTSDAHATLTSDGLTMFLERQVSPLRFDIFVSRRPALDVEFRRLDPVANLSMDRLEGAPSVSGDGEAIYFHSLSPGNQGFLLRSQRTQGLYSDGQPVPFLEPPMNAVSPVVTADELALYYLTEDDIWVARRASTAAPFVVEQRLTELNAPQPLAEFPSWISADECVIYFQPLATGGGWPAIYTAVRPL
jgi:hypothetical protein